MAEPENDKRVDDLLDSLLSGYSAAEPRPGLEMRIRAGLKAHARQRHRWALVFAASAALVILVVLFARTRRLQEIVPNRGAVVKTLPDPAPSPRNTAEPAPHRASSTTADRRRARQHNRPDSRMLLQAVNAMPRADNMIFAHEKLYLSTPPQPEQEAAREEHASTPDINIQHLGVRPIEIKDLTSTKDMN